MDSSEHRCGNATVGAMLGAGRVRLSVDSEHNSIRRRMSPEEAYTLAANIRDLPVDLLELGEPAEVADRLEVEAGRVEQSDLNGAGGSDGG